MGNSLTDKQKDRIFDIEMNANGGNAIFGAGFIMLFISLYCLFYLVAGLNVSKMRGRVFNKEFMEQFRSEL